MHTGRVHIRINVRVTLQHEWQRPLGESSYFFQQSLNIVVLPHARHVGKLFESLLLHREVNIFCTTHT